MGNLTKSVLKNCGCIRCGIWFGVNIIGPAAKRRYESKYRLICTDCLKLHEKKELILIMAEPNED